MINTVILSYVTFVYFIAFMLYLVMMVTGRMSIGRVATAVTLVNLAAHTFGIILRWVESHQMGIGRPPMANLYESLIFFAWTIVLFYVLLEWRTRNRSAGVFSTPLAFLAMAYASYSPNISDRIQPLLPALQSNWLISHVVTCFFGYAAFTIAFGLSIMLLIKQRTSENNGSAFARLIPRPHLLDDLIYQLILIGFLMLTLGIITGSVWAHSAWGSYWSWDPKETWSLITWFVYAALLHSRLIRGWRGKKIAVLSIIGFACVLFTYFGVNYLPSLHSYT